MLTASTLLITSAYAQTAAERALAQAEIEVTNWPDACLRVTSGTPYDSSYAASYVLDKLYRTSFVAASGIANQFIVI